MKVAILILIGTLAFGVFCATYTDAQDCTDDASNLRLYREMAKRGFTRWGCWTEKVALCRWTPPVSGGLVSYYILEVHGAGPLIDVDIVLKQVYADSVYTYWPAGVDSITGRVAAVGPDGRGAWTEPVIRVLN